MFCQKCGKEIKDDAKFCEGCGTPVNSVNETVNKVKQQPKKKKGLSGCFITILVFIVIIAIGIIAASVQNEGIQRAVSGVNNESEYITLEEYNKIENGMTYDEVKNIVGSAGTETATSSGYGVTITMVTWYGNGIAGSNANVTFQNGLVTGKAQVGLK